MTSIAVITIIETVIGNINADGGTSLMLFIYKEIIKNKDKTNGWIGNLDNSCTLKINWI